LQIGEAEAEERAVGEEREEAEGAGEGERVEAREKGWPGRGGNWVGGGGEEEEAPAGGLGVELHDLRVVADGSDRASKGRGGDDVGGQVEATDHSTADAGGGRGRAGRSWGGPRERGVERESAVEAVGEKVPLRRNGDGGGHRRADVGSVAGGEARRGGSAAGSPGWVKEVDSGIEVRWLGR